MIAQAAENIGGLDRLTKWARANKHNEYAFWVYIYPKLLPLVVAGDKNRPIMVSDVSAKLHDLVTRTLAARGTGEGAKLVNGGGEGSAPPPVVIHGKARPATAE